MADAIPMVTRTATRTLKYRCGDCGQPIRAGESYEDHRLPPGGGGMGYLAWQRTVFHAPSRYLPSLARVTGCELIAAYAEHAEREAAGCLRVAVIGEDRYPCRAHEGDPPAHHFAAHWPACPAPFCKLRPGHRGLHIIPAGKPIVIYKEAALDG